MRIGRMVVVMVMVMVMVYFRTRKWHRGCRVAGTWWMMSTSTKERRKAGGSTNGPSQAKRMWYTVALLPPVFWDTGVCLVDRSMWAVPCFVFSDVHLPYPLYFTPDRFFLCKHNIPRGVRQNQEGGINFFSTLLPRRACTLHPGGEQKQLLPRHL